jgi:hypothetical protein
VLFQKQAKEAQGMLEAKIAKLAPFWFISLDLIVAYIPMGYLGWKLAKKS